MTLFTPPPDYPRIRLVTSFRELVETRFAGGVNALCWPRELPGDFNEVVARLGLVDGVTTLDEADIAGLPVSVAGQAAAAVLLEDQRLLRAEGLAPTLDAVAGYLRDDAGVIVPTDVYSFHVDSATAEADTYLCSYTGAASEGLRNDEALRRVDLPATRAALLDLYGGADDGGFLDFLSERCYDLHYLPVAQAEPFSFGLGNLWRIAVRYPGSPVPPFIHRAPETRPGQPPRLLLIS